MSEMTFDYSVLRNIESGKYKLFNREQLRAVKKYDAAEMSKFAADVYVSGFKDGVFDMQKQMEDTIKQKQTKAEEAEEETRVDFDDILAAIAEVPGINAEHLAGIQKICDERFGQ